MAGEADAAASSSASQVDTVTTPAAALQAASLSGQTAEPVQQAASAGQTEQNSETSALPQEAPTHSQQVPI